LQRLLGHQVPRRGPWSLPTQEEAYVEWCRSQVNR
jgi:hypothetical protein